MAWHSTKLASTTGKTYTHTHTQLRNQLENWILMQHTVPFRTELKWTVVEWLCAVAIHWLKQMGSTTSFTVSWNLSPRTIPCINVCLCVCVSVPVCCINKINIYIEMQRNRAQPNWISGLHCPVPSLCHPISLLSCVWSFRLPYGFLFLNQIELRTTRTRTRKGNWNELKLNSIQFDCELCRI